MIEGHRVIALEEHYCDPALARPGPFADRLADMGEGRLAAMDRAGIDIQVLSHAPPGLQGAAKGESARLARTVNDRLAEVVARHPERFRAFASIPTSDAEAAADELERTVRDLGFCGAMVHGPTDGIFLDDRRFWPFLRRASDLGVPVYLHPADVLPAVREAYLGDLVRTHPMFAQAAWGFTIETGTHAMRLVLSGALKEFPRLQLILGHLGEAIPFLMPRIDEALARNTPTKDFSAQFRRHFSVTTSGFFATPATKLCVEMLGVDRVLFSVDWPFVQNSAAAEWAATLDFHHEDLEKLFNGNAVRLLNLERNSPVDRGRFLP